MDRHNELLKSKAVRKALYEKWKDDDGKVRCVSCRTTENIEWHHVIQLEVGGQDVFTNLFPACHPCHMAAHSWRITRKEKMANKVNKGGRKPEVPENYKDLLNEYIFCKIGKKELGEKWNKAMGKDTDAIPDAVSHISDKVWYKAYLEELGIEKVHNGIDAHISKRHPNNHKIKNGSVIGTITYANGETKDIIYENPDAVETKMIKIPQHKPTDSCLPENYKALLNDFIFCRIGFRALIVKWNVDPMSPASLVGYKQKKWFKDYLDELGIVGFNNKIDKPSKTDLKNGVIGYIKYKTGKTIELYDNELAKAE